MSGSEGDLTKYITDASLRENFASKYDLYLAGTFPQNYASRPKGGQENSTLQVAGLSVNSRPFNKASRKNSNDSPNITTRHSSPRNETLQLSDTSSPKTSKAHCEPRLLKPSTTHQTQNVKTAIECYKRHIPRINQVTPKNAGSILVEVLRETENEMLLSDFFAMLYNVQLSPSNSIVYNLGNSRLQFSSFETRLKGSVLCRLIRDTFTGTFPAAAYLGVNTSKSVFAFVNAHEFHRTFLAIKILLHCITKVEDPLPRKSSLSKTSVFNIYQIYCLRLLRANASSRNRVSSPESLLIGPASTGKLMKMIFPNIPSRRLGKRGSSKYHFMGVAFHKEVVDCEVLLLIDLEPSLVKQQFDIMKHTILESSGAPKHVPNSRLVARTHTKRLSGISQTPTPLFSYVSATSTLPEVNFAARIKLMTSNKIPQHHEWFKTTMCKSVDELKHHNMNLEPFIRTFQDNNFSAGPETSVSAAIISAKKALDHNDSPDEAYLHLYLVVLMLVFPAMLASNVEIRPTYKVLLRADLKRLAEHLETDVSPLPLESAPSRFFLINLRKLINLGEAVLVVIPKYLGADVLKVMIGDFLDIQKKNNLAAQNMSFDDVCSRAAVTVLNAHPLSFPSDEQAKINLIQRIIELFQRMFLKSLNDLQVMLLDLELAGGDELAESLPFNVFKLFSETFHDWLVSEPLLVKIPIPVLKFFFSRIDLDIQSANFKNFGKREAQVSAESFKTWWIITSSLHEYLGILSEVVALSQKLA